MRKSSVGVATCRTVRTSVVRRLCFNKNITLSAAPSVLLVEADQRPSIALHAATRTTAPKSAYFGIGKSTSPSAGKRHTCATSAAIVQNLSVPLVAQHSFAPKKATRSTERLTFLCVARRAATAEDSPRGSITCPYCKLASYCNNQCVLDDWFDHGPHCVTPLLMTKEYNVKIEDLRRQPCI